MQWTNTDQVVSWVIELEEQKYSFSKFGVVDYYPSISEELVFKSLIFAKNYISIPAEDFCLIKNACKSVLCEQVAM